MVVAPDTDSAQGWLSATLDASVPEGTTLQVVDSDGELVATFVTSKAVQNLVYSSADIKSGEQYEIYEVGTSRGSSASAVGRAGRPAAVLARSNSPSLGPEREAGLGNRVFPSPARCVLSAL
ncbi:hypothetical protein U9R90_16915 [Streptomyces sp. E11-3]|uniref:hypothetical protein n=1 Tax=Streptomyces sp. E11-3 TaxID=3110112 RepID=UPI0039815D6A